MTAFTPGAIVVPPPTPLASPKLTYEIGDECWIYVGVRDKAGNPVLSPGKVVYWVDLPAFACRFYQIFLTGLDWMQLETRDALRMAASKDAGLPFTKTRHDNAPRGADKKPDWRNS